jgi:hypothetical protein
MRDIEHRGHARGVVHGAVVDRVPVDRRTDAEMIEMRRDDDLLTVELAIASRQPGHDVG